MERVTVQVVSELAARVLVLHCRLERVSAATREISLVLEAPFREAVMVAVWSAERAAVETVKVPEVAFAATVTEAGTFRAETVLASVTEVPPAGAALERVTVQVVLALGARVLVLHCRLESVSAATSEMSLVLEAPFKEAVMVAV